MDQIFEDIGGLGRFQILVIFGMITTYTIMGWSSMQMSFSGIIPDWYCIINTPNRNELWNQSRGSNYGDDHNKSEPFIPIDNIYFENATWEVCSAYNATCDSFRFENSPLTIINQWDLVCDLSWVEQAVTSIQMVGILVGNFISSQLGDRFGRKKLYYGSLLEHALINVIAGFSVSWEMFAVCRFFIGVGIGCHMGIILPYCLEFFPTRWYTVLTSIPTFQIGISIFALVTFLLKNWAHVHFALAIFNTPFLLGWVFFPESPRWLAVHGRIDKALEALSKIAKINGKPLPDQAASILQSITNAQEKDGAKKKRFLFIELFNSWKSARTTGFVCFIWAVISALYDGISLSASNFEGVVYLNIFIMAMSDIPMMVLVMAISNKIGRRTTMTITTGVNALAIGGCIVSTIFKKAIITTVLAFIAKMMVCSCLNLVMVWSNELYPTAVRGMAFGLFNLSGQIGSITCPYVVNLNDMALVSYIIMTSLSAICVFISIGIPETRWAEVSDTQNTEVQVEAVDEKSNVLRTSMERERKMNYGLTESKGKGDYLDVKTT